MSVSLSLHTDEHEYIQPIYAQYILRKGHQTPGTYKLIFFLNENVGHMLNPHGELLLKVKECEKLKLFLYLTN
jgi:hypothetical protein